MIRKKLRGPPWWFVPAVLMGSVAVGSVAAVLISFTAY